MRLLNPILIYFFCSEIQCKNELTQSEKHNKALCFDLTSKKEVTADSCGCSEEEIKTTSVTDSLGTPFQFGPSGAACHTECMQQLGFLKQNVDFDFGTTKAPTSMPNFEYFVPSESFGMKTTEIASIGGNNGGMTYDEPTCHPRMLECLRKCKEEKQTPIEKFLAKPLTTQKRLKIFVANNPRLQTAIAAQIKDKSGDGFVNMTRLYVNLNMTANYLEIAKLSADRTEIDSVVTKVVVDYHSLINSCNRALWTFKQKSKLGFDNVIKAAKWAKFNYTKRALEYLAYNSKIVDDLANLAEKLELQTGVLIAEVVDAMTAATATKSKTDNEIEELKKMEEVKAQIEKDVEDRAAKHAENQRKYEQAQTKLEQEQDTRYIENKKRAIENKKRAFSTAVKNVFTMGIYGALTERWRENERNHLNEKVANAQRRFDEANRARLEAEKQFIIQLDLLSSKMVKMTENGRTSEPDLAHLIKMMSWVEEVLGIVKIEFEELKNFWHLQATFCRLCKELGEKSGDDLKAIISKEQNNGGIDVAGNCGEETEQVKDLFEENLLQTIVHWLVIIDNSNNAFLGIQAARVNMNRLMTNMGGLTDSWRLRSKDQQQQLVTQKMALIQDGIQKKKKDFCCKDMCTGIIKNVDPTGVRHQNLDPEHERIQENEG